MQDIMIPVALMAGLGVLFGAMIAVFGKLLAVPGDESINAVRAALPGANCGGCGFPGCDALAAAIARGEAPLNACPVGGVACAEEIARIMGVEVPKVEKRKVARVICQGSTEHCKNVYEYIGIADCRAAAMVASGSRACRHACLGLGTCASVCRFGAIHMEGGIAVIDAEKCAACGMCVAICPKHVIDFEIEELPILLRCRSALRGKAVHDACDRGCIACGKCAKACQYGVITLENNLPVLDVSKCVGCGACARACPTRALRDLRPEDDFDPQPVAEAAAE